MKVIDLLNMIEKCEYPREIEVLGHRFVWDYLEGFYKEVVDGADLMEMTNSYPIYEFLDLEVKIADKNKGQEEIDIQGIEELDVTLELKSVNTEVSREENLKRIDKTNVDYFYRISDLTKQQNQILKALKQLDNKINGK